MTSLTGGAIGSGGVIERLIGSEDTFADGVTSISSVKDGTTYSIETSGGNTIAKDFYSLNVDSSTGKVTYSEVTSGTALSSSAAYAVKDKDGNYKLLTNYYVKATTSSSNTSYALVTPGAGAQTGGAGIAFYKVDSSTTSGLASVAESAAPTAGAIPSFHVFVNARTGVKGLEQTVNEVVSQTGVASASDALKLQLEFIRYSTQITGASQMTKTIGDAMSATVRNIG